LFQSDYEFDKTDDVQKSNLVSVSVPVSSGYGKKAQHVSGIFQKVADKKEQQVKKQREKQEKEGNIYAYSTCSTAN
jgi:hypothetical protein